VLALTGLAGLPPGLAGLFAKVTVIAALINAGWGWLAAVVALNALIALAYYVRVAALLYTRPEPVGVHFADLPAPEPAATGSTVTAVADPELLQAATHPRIPVPRPVAAAVAVAVTVTVILGFAPQWIFDALLG
jgi:NADH-quinone oxidoreductase subunit N